VKPTHNHLLQWQKVVEYRDGVNVVIEIINEVLLSENEILKMNLNCRLLIKFCSTKSDCNNAFSTN
jgi:hypothetical protein